MELRQVVAWVVTKEDCLQSMKNRQPFIAQSKGKMYE
jgi:hypothetical protein